MQEVIRELARKHGLVNADVVAVVERVFSEMLTTFYGYEVTAILDASGNFSATAYRQLPDGTYLPVEVEPAILRRLHNGRTPAALDRAMIRLKTTLESHHYKRFKHKLFWGEIIGQAPDNGALRVEIEMDDTRLIATCPLNLLGPHERYALTAGQRRAFVVRQITPEMLNGTPRLHIVLDRVSRVLTEQVLRHFAAYPKGIVCHQRYVGKKSWVTSPLPLPREAIIAARNELGEHIQVNLKKINARGVSHVTKRT